MSNTPSPVLVAAVPVLTKALTDLKAALTTILTGDPAQIALRVGPAVAILDNQILLLLPELASAEEPVVLQTATNGIDGLISKLNALAQPSTAIAAPQSSVVSSAPSAGVAS